MLKLSKNKRVNVENQLNLLESSEISTVLHPSLMALMAFLNLFYIFYIFYIFCVYICLWEQWHELWLYCSVFFQITKCICRNFQMVLPNH